MVLLQRFQMKSRVKSTNKLDPKLPIKAAKQLHEVMDIEDPCEFLVPAKVVDLYYEIYEACPYCTKFNMFCNKKLNKERHCSECNRSTKTLQNKLWIHIVLKDPKQQEFKHHAIGFQTFAEEFLGMNMAQIQKMKEDQQAAEIQAKLGFLGLFKIKVKHLADWVLMQFRPLIEKEIEEAEEGQEDEESKEVEPKTKKAKKVKKVKTEEEEDGQEELEHLMEPSQKKTKIAKK